MRLVVVGCAGSFPSADSACSAYLVQADDEAGRTWTVLLDVGNETLWQLTPQRMPHHRCADLGAAAACIVSHAHAGALAA